ncbi:MAG TPA: type II toxin-antitoxin system HicA family toxin [Sedimentisphaerales bacterium]|nr:type II toxin-antitoxin system HicA family toxin [Sedimentisphaerales bacterium]
MTIPRQYRFKDLVKLLRSYRIEWNPRKGKGSHGAFVGPDLKGNIQSYTLPRHQQREVKKRYIKGICDRFQLDDSKLFG